MALNEASLKSYVIDESRADSPLLKIDAYYYTDDGQYPFYIMALKRDLFNQPELLKLIRNHIDSLLLDSQRQTHDNATIP